MDLDDLLFYLSLAVTHKLNRNFGTHYKPDDITEYNWVRDALMLQGYSFAEADVRQNTDYWDNPDVVMSAPLIEGAREITLAMVRADIEIFPTTSRNPSLTDVTRRQLRRYLGWIPEDNLLIRRRGDEDKHGFKPRAINRRKLPFFFENYPGHGRAILASTDAHLALCPYWPRYKQEFPDVVSHPRTVKLRSLSAVAEVIDPFMRRMY
jgi:hypothetical protein